MSAGLWDRIAAFFRSPREPYQPGPEPFLKPDLEAFRSRFQPAQRGDSYGAKDLPASDVLAPDSREVEITTFVEAELERANQQIAQNLDALLASIRQLSGTSGEAEIRQLTDVGLSEMAALAQRCRNRIDVTLRHANDLAGSFARFRQLNKRESLPDLNHGGLVPWSLFFLMITIEAAINGNLFAQGSDYGLLGGVMLAFIFAIINVGLGGVTGVVAVRQLFHVSLIRRIVGGVGFALALGLDLLFNTSVAHFRDAIGSGATQSAAAAAVLPKLWPNPFALTDFTSWLLLGLGLAFFALSCYDGFQLDDPYPSYGRRYRSLRKGKEDYERAVEDAHRSMAEIRDGYTRQIVEVVQKQDVYAQHLERLKDKIARLCKSYHQHCEMLERFSHVLIEEYREANRRRRSTPPPAYFALTHLVNVGPLPVYELPSPPPPLATAASAAVAALTQAHDGELQRLMPLAQLGSADVA